MIFLFRPEGDDRSAAKASAVIAAHSAPALFVFEDGLHSVRLIGILTAGRWQIIARTLASCELAHVDCHSSRPRRGATITNCCKLMFAIASAVRWPDDDISGTHMCTREHTITRDEFDVTSTAYTSPTGYMVELTSDHGAQQGGFQAPVPVRNASVLLAFRTLTTTPSKTRMTTR